MMTDASNRNLEVRNLLRSVDRTADEKLTQQYAS